MPPRKRNAENGGLPSRWRHYHGAYYYRVLPGQEPQWDGKKQFRLGATLPEAYRTWSERLEHLSAARTVADLLDRYALEVIPTKAPKTRKEQTVALQRLRRVFGHMTLADSARRCLLEPHHAYAYLDKRVAKNPAYSGKTAGKRELEVLSHALTKAVEWGLIRANPLIGQFTVKGKGVTNGRSRYVEDWEVDELMKLRSKRKRGSIAMLQAYVQIKKRIGLRATDMLLLKIADLRADGIHVTPHKTAASSGKRTIYRWTPELREYIEAAKAARPVDIGPYLFCNREGKPYFNEEAGTANGFESIWRRFMDRALAETALTERFAERDLRAKAGTDADSPEHAQRLLAHTDSRTTKRFYRRKPEEVEPIKGA